MLHRLCRSSVSSSLDYSCTRCLQATIMLSSSESCIDEPSFNEHFIYKPCIGDSDQLRNVGWHLSSLRYAVLSHFGRCVETGKRTSKRFESSSHKVCWNASAVVLVFCVDKRPGAGTLSAM